MTTLPFPLTPSYHIHDRHIATHSRSFHQPINFEIPMFSKLCPFAASMIIINLTLDLKDFRFNRRHPLKRIETFKKFAA